MLPFCSAAPFATDLWVAVEMRMSQRDVNGLGRRGSAVNTSSVLQKAAKRQAAPRCSVRLSNCGAQLGPHQQQSCFCTACHEQRLLCRSPATAAQLAPLRLYVQHRAKPCCATAASSCPLRAPHRAAPESRPCSGSAPPQARPAVQSQCACRSPPCEWGWGARVRQGGFIVYVRRAVHPRFLCRINASVAASHAGSGARAQ